MRLVGLMLAVVVVVGAGLYVDLWWEATSLADGLKEQSVKLLTSPQRHYDAEVIAQMLDQRAATRGLALKELRVSVGPASPVKIGNTEYRPNDVDFEYVARRTNATGALFHLKVKGTAKFLVNSGPHEWPAAP